MEDKSIFLTKEGREKLISELDNLIKVERPNVIQEIKDARSLGDLSENAEYTAAREKQAKIEDRIRELQTILEVSTTSQKTKLKTKVINIGSIVNIKNLQTNEEKAYQIVGILEVDPLAEPIAKISNESPLAKSIIGKKEQDVVEVRATHNYKIQIIKVKS